MPFLGTLLEVLVEMFEDLLVTFNTITQSHLCCLFTVD